MSSLSVSSAHNSSTADRKLSRELGTAGAVMMGLGSIVGTGVFVSIGIAAGVAGPGVLPAIAVAACVACCNGLSSAQLAAAHPVSGGTYEYGYAFLRPLFGFTAGWMFLIAKSASAATAALGLSGYLLSALRVTGGAGTAGSTAAASLESTTAAGHAPVLLAVASVLALTILVAAGVRKSNRVNVAIVSFTLAALLLYVLAGIPQAIRAAPQSLRPLVQGGTTGDGTPLWRLLSASALMFVSFTGYGRIATLGEEVRRPERSIPRAVIAALAAVTLLYLAVAFVSVAGYGWSGLAAAVSGNRGPLEAAALSFAGPPLAALVGLAAVTAMAGVLLNLILGLSRVLLAMGRRRDMPGILGMLDKTGTAPTPAVITVGVLVSLVVLVGDVRLTWSFSAFSVLLYYAITNAAALALPAAQRRFSRAVPVAGLTGCLGLALFVEPIVLLTGFTLVAVGIGWFAVAARQRRRHAA